MKACPDCGNAPVNHYAEWVASIVSKALVPKKVRAKEPPTTIDRITAGPLANVFTPALMKLLVAVRLARFVDKPDTKTNHRSEVMWEEAIRRGLTIREFRLFHVGREAFLVTYKGKHKTFLDLPRPGDIASHGLSWMGNKDILRERLEAANIPTPRGGSVSTEKKAREMFRKLHPPLITKPEVGSRSRHTTTHLNSEEELVKAFRKAKILSRWVVIAEEAVGLVHRGTVVGGKLVAVLRREPPMVVGDGVHTVSELVAIENKNPRRDGSTFHQLVINEGAVAELASQGLLLDSIPQNGEIITLSQKSSRGIGGGATDLTENMHPDNVRMLEAAAVVIDDPLIGFDFIIDDVTRSWKEQDRCGIIEANSMPFIDLHHYPLVGSPRNVAGDLWNLVLATWP